LETKNINIPLIDIVPIPTQKKSPLKKLFVSPLRTPLLLRDQQKDASYFSGSIKTPRSNFDRLNNVLNANATRAKRKLEYNLFPEEKSTATDEIPDFLKENKTPSNIMPEANPMQVDPSTLLQKRKQSEQTEGPVTPEVQTEESKKPKI